MSNVRPLPPIALDPEGVVFDMDGVLCDSEPLWAAARFAVAEAVGSSITVDDFHAFYGSNTSQWSAGMATLFGHPDPAEIARRSHIAYGIVKRQFVLQRPDFVHRDCL